MRKNSRLFLLLLYLLSNADNKADFQWLYMVFSQLSEGGVRSMVWLLKRDGYIVVSNDGKLAEASLSKKGIQWVTEEYIKCADTSSYVFFLVAKDSLKLRKKLQSVGAVLVRKGVWLLTENELKSARVEQLKHVVWKKMTLDEGNNEEFLSLFLQEKDNLEKERRRWSGISIQANTLIKKNTSKKVPTKKDFSKFLHLLSLIDDRLMEKQYRFNYQRRYLHSSVTQTLEKLIIIARMLQS